MKIVRRGGKYIAYEAGSVVGQLRVYPTAIGAREQPITAIGGVEVVESHRRRGVMTRLYERAARDACRDGRPLASVERFAGAKSNDFWRKQVTKGRATKHRGQGYDGQTAYVLRCPVSDLSGLR